jgi:hypothetical protein
MKNQKTKMLVILLSSALVVLVGWCVHVYLDLRNPVRAKTTEARMLALMGVLEAEEPQKLDPETLRPLLEKYNRLECLEDAWGTPFVIERSQTNGHSQYTIISLGRDGRRGSCCKKWVGSWDDDGVLSGKEWLQVWNPKAAKAMRLR